MVYFVVPTTLSKKICQEIARYIFVPNMQNRKQRAYTYMIFLARTMDEWSNKHIQRIC
jgi:hypothetical protein